MKIMLTRIAMLTIAVLTRRGITCRLYGLRPGSSTFENNGLSPHHSRFDSLSQWLFCSGRSIADFGKAIKVAGARRTRRDRSTGGVKFTLESRKIALSNAGRHYPGKLGTRLGR